MGEDRVTFTAVGVPLAVQAEVLALLMPYSAEFTLHFDVVSPAVGAVRVAAVAEPGASG